MTAKTSETKVIGKGLCRQCGGSGSLLRPLKSHGLIVKLNNFVRCSSCGGHGMRRSMSKE